MKRLIVLLSVFANVALLAWALHLHGRLLRARADAHTAKLSTEEAWQKAEASRDQEKLLEDQLTDAHRQQGGLKKELSSLRETAALKPTVTTPVAVTVEPPQEARAEEREGGMLDRLGEMMENPEARKAMRAQQKMVLNMMYGALFEDLVLGDDELDLLKDILVDRQMLGLDLIGKAKGDPEGMAEAMREAREENGERLAELLGDEGYEAFKDYESTLAERMMLSQFKQSLGGGDAQLAVEQEEGLLELMVKEREAVGMPDQQEQAAEFMAGGVNSTKMIEEYLVMQEAANERVLAGAADILTETQLKQFGDFQKGQLQMQKLGIEMLKGRKKE